LTEQLGGRLDDGQPVLVVPVLVSSCQECGNHLVVCADGELVIGQTTGQVLGRVHVGMLCVPADHTAERLLVRTVLAGDTRTVACLQ
jgi:hypothetical protein